MAGPPPAPARSPVPARPASTGTGHCRAAAPRVPGAGRGRPARRAGRGRIRESVYRRPDRRLPRMAWLAVSRRAPTPVFGSAEGRAPSGRMNPRPLLLPDHPVSSAWRRAPHPCRGYSAGVDVLWWLRGRAAGVDPLVRDCALALGLLGVASWELVGGQDVLIPARRLPPEPGLVPLAALMIL